MVRIICDSYEFQMDEIRCKEPNHRYITIEFDTTTDQDIISQIENVLNQQPKCENCINYQSDGYFCGYKSHSCKLHGNIEFCSHPHHDGDGSKCKDYRRQIKED